MLILSELTLYYFDVIHSLKSASRAPSTASLSEGPVKDWAKKVVVSKSPQDGKVCKFTVSLRTCPTLKPCQGVVHIIQTNDNAQRGRKRTLSVTEDSELGDLTPEEQQEVQEDPDADLTVDSVIIVHQVIVIRSANLCNNCCKL
jgi:hypothetical protein